MAPAEGHGGRSERRVVSWLLRVGLAVAAAGMTLGLVWALASGHLAAQPFRFDDLGRGQAGAALMGVGLVVLALTPAARVLALVVDFSLERDWKFAAVAVGVAVLLAVGIVLGHL